jgi:hypothetical protein
MQGYASAKKLAIHLARTSGGILLDNIDKVRIVKEKDNKNWSIIDLLALTPG